MGTSEGRIVTIPASSNSSLRSFARTSAVSKPSRSSRSSVSASSAPRGTATVRLTSAALPDASGVQPLAVEREPAGRQLAPEAPEQVVVAPAAADRRPQGGVVDLPYRAGVVAQRAR